jgi:hypothetical protein
MCSSACSLGSWADDPASNTDRGTVELQPIVQSAPREQAERIYAALLRRERLAPRRRDETLSGFELAHDLVWRLFTCLGAASCRRPGSRLRHLGRTAAGATDQGVVVESGPPQEFRAIFVGRKFLGLRTPVSVRSRTLPVARW